MRKSVVIVGGGLGGLAIGALLSKKGFQVTILEKNEQLGGRMRVFEKDGFTFDMGPTWYLMPDVFERFFGQFHKSPHDLLDLKRLDPSYRIFFSKDDIVNVPAKSEEAIKLFDRLEKNGGEKLRKYLDISKAQYEVSMKRFFYKDYKKVSDFFSLKLLKEGRKIKAFDKIGSYVDRYFDEDRAKKVLLYNIVFLGGSPENIPALYSIMAHVDFNLGVFFPKGGMRSVLNSVLNLAKQNGALIKTNTPVKEVVVENGSARGVKTEDEYFEADLVVSGAEYHHVETELLEEKYQNYKKSYWEKKTFAPSALIAFIGLKKPLSKILHHTLFFDYDWVEHFNTIFKKPSWPKYPSFYTCSASKSDFGLAPEGCETLFLLVPVSVGLKDTDAFREKYLKMIIERMEEVIGESIQDSILFKKIYSHRDFKSDYNAYEGTSLGLAHTLRQSAVFRPAHKSKKVDNLYYVGQYTHPGIGVPSTIGSAQIVYDKILNDVS